MNRKAEMGIGTLIIFIAMILVAAIAAGVLIQTASALQNKALLTGERSKNQVSTSVRPMLVYAEDGSSGNNVDQIFMKVKLAPGSDPVRFSDMLVEFSLKNLSADLTYSSAETCTTVNESNGSFFYLDYLIQGDNYQSGYLQRGDVIKLCFESSRQIGEDESVSITIVPKIGNPTVVETALPDIITEKRVTMYP